MQFIYRTLAFAGLAFATPAIATVTTLDFTAGGVPSQSGPIPGVQFDEYDLTNTVTGDSTTPILSIANGDELTGTISLAQPVTLSASSYLIGTVFAFGFDDALSTISSVDFDATMHLFNGSTDVTPVSWISGNLGTGTNDQIVVAGLGGDPGSSVSFDRVVYDITFTGLYDSVGDAVGSGLIAGTDSSLLTFAISAPEPSTWALTILGFAAVGIGLRRRTARSLARFAAA